MQKTLTLLDVVERQCPPEPWREGDNIPWNDPAFSARMLREHLTSEHDLASRRAAIIDEHVAWIHREVLRERPSRALDLGCGPGLYAHRLGRCGHRCTGIDFGPASIAHARTEAGDLGCTFTLGDLREADFGGGFDLVMMIYGQFNVFRREEARAILGRARSALVPGGRLLLEPQTEAVVRADEVPSATWTSADSGLFSERPHLVLHERFWNENARASTERWHIVHAGGGGVERHALSCAAYSEGELTDTLVDAGFRDIEHLPGLPGNSERGALWAVLASAG